MFFPRAVLINPVTLGGSMPAADAPEKRYHFFSVLSKHQ
jgi:hypothetical protein